MALDPRLILAQRLLPSVAEQDDKRQERLIQQQEVQLRAQDIQQRGEEMRQAAMDRAAARLQKTQPSFDPKKESEYVDYQIKVGDAIHGQLQNALDNPDAWPVIRTNIGRLAGPQAMAQLPEEWNDDTANFVGAQVKAWTPHKEAVQKASRHLVTTTNAAGDTVQRFVDDTSNEDYPVPTKPTAATNTPNPTEASLAVAAAKGDPDAAKALRIMRAQRVGSGGGGASSAPPSAPGAVNVPDVAPGEKNDAYLQSLDAPTQAMVKALAEGRKAFPNGSALRADYWQKMLGAVAKYDPSFDEINYNNRAATRKDFTSGKTADQIRSVNTAIGHLKQLSDAADALNNSDFQTYNRIANALATEFGWTGETDYNTILNRVAPEITRVWRGTGGNESDIARDIDTMKSSRAGGQIHGAIANLGGMLESQLESTQERYRQGMGTADIQVLRPDSRATLDVLEQRAGKTPAAQPVGRPSAAAPAASSGPKVGDTVTYNGKRYKVTGIARGQAQLEALP